MTRTEPHEIPGRIYELVRILRRIPMNQWDDEMHITSLIDEYARIAYPQRQPCDCKAIQAYAADLADHLHRFAVTNASPPQDVPAPEGGGGDGFVSVSDSIGYVTAPLLSHKKRTPK